MPAGTGEAEQCEGERQTGEDQRRALELPQGFDEGRLSCQILCLREQDELKVVRARNITSTRIRPATPTRAQNAASREGALRRGNAPLKEEEGDHGEGDYADSGLENGVIVREERDDLACAGVGRGRR